MENEKKNEKNKGKIEEGKNKKNMCRCFFLNNYVLKMMVRNSIGVSNCWDCKDAHTHTHTFLHRKAVGWAVVAMCLAFVVDDGERQILGLGAVLLHGHRGANFWLHAFVGKSHTLQTFTLCPTFWSYVAVGSTKSKTFASVRVHELAAGVHTGVIILPHTENYSQRRFQ